MFNCSFTCLFFFGGGIVVLFYQSLGCFGEFANLMNSDITKGAYVTGCLRFASNESCVNALFSNDFVTLPFNFFVYLFCTGLLLTMLAS